MNLIPQQFPMWAVHTADGPHLTANAVIAWGIELSGDDRRPVPFTAEHGRLDLAHVESYIATEDALFDFIRGA